MENILSQLDTWIAAAGRTLVMLWIVFATLNLTFATLSPEMWLVNRTFNPAFWLVNTGHPTDYWQQQSLSNVSTASLGQTIDAEQTSLQQMPHFLVFWLVSVSVLIEKNIYIECKLQINYSIIKQCIRNSLKYIEKFIDIQFWKSIHRDSSWWRHWNS